VREREGGKIRYILIFSMGVIDHILLTCKRATDTPGTLRHAALGEKIK